jgi:RND superfamily putative drug exporter
MSVFNSLGVAVTKYPKTIIALWVLVLLVSLPLTGVFAQNMSSDMQKFIPKNLGAVVAGDKYDEQFSTGVSSQAIVVVQTDDRLQAMRFIDELDKSVLTDPNIRNLTGTSSIFSVQRSTLAAMTPDLYRSLYAGYDSALAAAGMTDAAGNLTAPVKAAVASGMANSMGLPANTTYLAALLNLPRNMSDDVLEAFATRWVSEHGYADPAILPASAVKNLVGTNVSLYVITTDVSTMWSNVSDNTPFIRGAIANVSKDPQFAGVNAYVTGEAALNYDYMQTNSGDPSTMLTIIMVLLVLLLYFRSVTAPATPLAIIVVALIVGMGIMGIISTMMNLYVLVQILMVVILLGAGTDYCVFIMSRYAEERSSGTAVKDSVRAAVAQAGRSVASSGLTAMIGFLALTVLDEGIFRSLGVGMAVAIFCGMMAALTLLPAVMTLAGDKVFWPRKIYNAGPSLTGGIWRAITSRVLKHAKLVMVLAVLITIPSIAVFSQMQLGNDSISGMPDDLESKAGFDLLTSQIGSDSMGQAMVVATMPYDVRDSPGHYSAGALADIEDLSTALAGVPGVEKVYSMTRPEGVTISYNNLSAYQGSELAMYQQYMNSHVGRDDRTTVVSVSYAGSPYSDAAQKTTDAIRDVLATYESGHADTELLLGGSVGGYEYQKMVTDKYPLVVGIVIAGIFLVLMFLLRSVFTPIRLIATLLMSLVWALAVFILVFQFWLGASISWIMPIFLFCVLMGLGTDYDIFLVSRIREEVLKGKTEEEAILTAVSSTGTIITLCGAVMAAAFGAMMLSPMVMNQEIGFALSLAVILDATLMRMVVVPAAMVLMKKYNWWMPFVKSEEQKLDEKKLVHCEPAES